MNGNDHPYLETTMDNVQIEHELAHAPKPREKGPEYYQRLTPEPIDVIMAWNLNHPCGSAVKYIARHGHKPGASAVSDLRKAAHYLLMYADFLEDKQ